MRNTRLWMVLLALPLSVGGCGSLSTPSMVNDKPLRLSEETSLRQMPVSHINDNSLYVLSKDYERFGEGAMNLTLLYDPASKTFGKGEAFKEMAAIKEKLSSLGVRGIKADVVETSGMEPTLMIHYDSVQAMAPEGCRPMPGLEDGLTTREIGDYRFGCSVDTMLAKQIYRPSDLRGEGATDPVDGRRATNNSEYYRQVTQQEAEGELRVYTRDDVQQ